MKKSNQIVLLGSIVVAIGVAIYFIYQKKSNLQDKTVQKTTSTVPASGTASSNTSSTLEIKASEVFTLSPQNLSQTIALTGTIKAVQSAFVKVKVAGEISGLTLREGENVKAGQVLGKIDATEAIARFKQAQQQAASAKSQLDIAQRQFDNNQALMTQGFISKTALDNASSSFNGAKASYQAAL